MSTCLLLLSADDAMMQKAGAGEQLRWDGVAASPRADMRVAGARHLRGAGGGGRYRIPPGCSGLRCGVRAFRSRAGGGVRVLPRTPSSSPLVLLEDDDSCAFTPFPDSISLHGGPCDCCRRGASRRACRNCQPRKAFLNRALELPDLSQKNYRRGLRRSSVQSHVATAPAR